MSDNGETIELLPCPFCGGQASMTFSTFDLCDGWHVACVGSKDCVLFGSEPYRPSDTLEEARKIWNTRLNTTVPDEVVKALGVTEGEAGSLVALFVKCGGKSFEAKDPNGKTANRLIELGMMRRCDMRCGFEAMKDAGLAWTPAGRAVVAALQTIKGNGQ